MNQIIQSHNKRVISPKNEETPPCNCQNECPIDEKCQTQNSVYKCVASTTRNPPKNYIGIAKGEWKKRHRVRKTSFKHETQKTDTSFASCVWETRDTINETPTLKWSILKTAPPYTNKSKRCLLCLNEKLMITTYPDENSLLNKRT